MDWSKIGDPDFSNKMVAQLDDAVRRGALGLKVLKDWGLGVKDKSGRLVAIDDPHINAVREECGRLKIPVARFASEPVPEMYGNYFRWLETADEYFR